MSTIRGIVVATVVTAALAVVAVPPGSAAAAGCTPRVALSQVYTDTAGVTHYVSTYRTCGREMALKLKVRVGHEPYVTIISSPVRGTGTVDYLDWGCGGTPAPPADYLVTLKIGQVLYAKSAPVTYTIPPRPPC